MPDLTPWLQEWPWRPGRLDVRRATGADGRLLLQVRIEMGFVQMEADGRPDGQGFRNAPSALAWFEGEGVAQPIDTAHVSALAVEMSQRRQRGLACAALEDWGRVRRDALDNLRALDLLSARAVEPLDRARFEPWRPHELAMRARAEAAVGLAAGRRDLAIAALEAGLRSVQESLQRQGRGDRVDVAPEVGLLRTLLDALALKLPASQRLEIERRLREAVMSENYELAAILRNELRMMEGGA